MSQDNPTTTPELPAFTQMLREMGVPFCWYRNSEALMDRYAQRIDGEFYLRNIRLVAVEVGNSLFVFETESDRFVLTDLKHSEKSLPGSFADGVEGNDLTLLMRTHPIARAGFEDEGEIAAHPDRGRTEQPCISRSELECHADTSNKIDEWLSVTSTTLAAMLEGHEHDSDDSSVVYDDVRIMEPSEVYGRNEWSVSFLFKDHSRVLCSVEFPARYLWMENWREQLKLDSEMARRELHARDVSIAEGKVSDAERKLNAAKRELFRMEKKEL